MLLGSPIAINYLHQLLYLCHSSARHDCESYTFDKIQCQICSLHIALSHSAVCMSTSYIQWWIFKWFVINCSIAEYFLEKGMMLE